MDAKVVTLLKEYEDACREYDKLRYFTTDKELQTNLCKDLDLFFERAIKLKDEMRSQNKEDEANIILGFECITRAFIYELKTFISLKENEHDKAWNYLMSAQKAVRFAILSHKLYASSDSEVERLHILEELLFPPQIFVSSGFTVKKYTCSICGSEYGECDHIVNNPYMGEMCFTIPDIERITEASIVKNPADKRCRIVSIREGDITRDTMTYKIIDNPEDIPKESKNGVSAQAAILALSMFERLK